MKRAPDTTFLWYLADPSQPRLVGALRLVLGNRSVSLTYSADWLARGFPISEDLPLAARRLLDRLDHALTPAIGPSVLHGADHLIANLRRLLDVDASRYRKRRSGCWRPEPPWAARAPIELTVRWKVRSLRKALKMLDRRTR